MELLPHSMTLLYFFIALCLVLMSPINGTVEREGNTAGAIAAYTCDSGFELVGPSERTCQINGQWNGSAPVCRGTCSMYNVHINYNT